MSIDKQKLAAACRTQDNLTDIGVSTEEILHRVDVDPAGARYVAEQRAMRVVLAAQGRLASIDPTRPVAIRFTQQDHVLITQLASAWIDGLSAGLRAKLAEGK